MPPTPWEVVAAVFGSPGALWVSDGRFLALFGYVMAGSWQVLGRSSAGSSRGRAGSWQVLGSFLRRSLARRFLAGLQGTPNPPRWLQHFLKAT